MPCLESSADQFLDAVGEACGTVTPLIKQALSTLQAAQVLEVLTHDPATRAGVPAWCRLTGHVLVQTRVEGGPCTRFWIRKTPRSSQPT
ncbi:MAG TPA: sulfurtransferase TusA family protein [Burkholderiaceae bacterium]|nr:sulfurtransferase TusA family protein [Burkholderiaceae bacterium]